MPAARDEPLNEPRFPDLRAFLDQLRREGDLATVTVPVDPRLEAAEIHRRVIAAGGPALLFTRPVGADVPLVTNLFGTRRRAEMAFGARPLRLVRRLVELAETVLPPTPGKLWRARDLAGELMRVGTRRRRTAPVTEVVTADVQLDRLPALTCWPEDGGAFVTLGLVYTEHPDGKGSNLGIYRLQVYDRRRTGMHWQIGKGGGFHYAVAEARGESLPATVLLGGPPALTLAAIAPLPENVPELMLASLIAGRKLDLVRGPGPHPLVGGCEIALVGAVPPGLRRAEGPFGDHYGYYSLRHDFPVFEVRHLARRRDALYPATVVGKPRQEDFFIGDLLQELLSPLFPLVMPGVESVWAYGETGYHSLAAAVVKQRYPREALRSAFRILGEGQLSLTKFLLLTDRAVDLKDFPATLQHVLARTDPRTDLYVFANTSMDTLDYTGPRINEGSKGVWLGLGDPVRELPREFRPRPHRRAAPRRAQRDQLPLDDLHALRAGRRPLRRLAADGAASRRLRPAHPHRRPPQAGLSPGAVRRPRDRRPRQPALERVLRPAGGNGRFRVSRAGQDLAGGGGGGSSCQVRARIVTPSSRCT
jgi:UbiD family decarboxylase